MHAASANVGDAPWREHESGPALSRGEVGLLLFLASEVMFFAGLVAAAIVLRSADVSWSSASARLARMPAVTGTVLLVLSSVALELGARRPERTRALVVAGAVLGAGFLALQTFEYRTLLEHGLRWTSGVFGSCFWVITALHALHVFAGVAWLAVVAARGSDTGLVRRYWHLVGGVWIGLFLFFYVS